MKKCTNKILAFALAATMVVTGAGASMATSQVASAKKVKVTLKAKKKKVSVTVGKKVTLKIVKKNVKKIKSMTWKSKNKKIATVNKKGKVTGKKAGKKTTITCKFKYKAKGSKKWKNKTIKFTVSVTAKKTTSDKNTNTDSNTNTTVKKSKNGIVMYDDGVMDKTLTATQLMSKMGQGWNLGNTMEACGDAADTKGFTAAEFETFWQKVPTTQKTMDGIHTYGVNCVRIPVAWSNMISDDGKYTINDDYFNRVETIMNYAFKAGMYAIVNIHYDSDWWGQFGDKDQAVRDKAWARFEAFWTQIANRYSEYGDRLIFESANEELGDRLNDDWEQGIAYGNAGGNFGTLTEDECYSTTNAINQKFVDIVRATGGNNKYRQLLIAGYNTDIGMTTDDRYVMPTDIAENGKTKLNVSVHYYSPSTYCIAEDPNNSWGYAAAWGTDSEVKALHADLDKMKKFTAEGYGVIIGEFAVCNARKSNVAQYTKEVMTYANSIGMVPVLWDTGVYYDRSTGLMKFSDIAKVYNDVTGSKGIINDDMDITGPVEPTIVDEENLTKVATWEGAWTRTGNTSITAGFSTTSEGFTSSTVNGADGKPRENVMVGDNGFTLGSNFAYWQLFFTYDWSTLTSPAIRITLADDATSKKAPIQIGYTTGIDGDIDFIDLEGINAECITLNAKKLKTLKWVGLSSTTAGATIAKIEIFDTK